MKAIPYPLRGEWLITDEGAALVMGVWETAQLTGRAERIALALEARDGQPFANERRCVVTDGIAVMDIDGPLMRKAELFSDISGATSYQWIGATADALRADTTVKKVIIRANSPGGEAAGVGECAEKLARLAAEKHVEGYVETQAASAMLWLLAQCTHITAHQTAQVGWIGAVRRMTDTAKRDEKDGVTTREFVSKGAEKKRTYPFTDAVAERVQRPLDKWGALFTSAVAAGRNVSEKAVLEDFGGGDGMFAEQALAAGLIDAVGDFESTLAGLAGVAPAGGMTRASVRPGDTMQIKDKNTTAAAATDVTTTGAGGEWQCAGCNESMGQSAKAFCTKCQEDGGDEDNDEEDGDQASALGMSDVKATRTARRARMVELATFEASVFEATGGKSRGSALALIANGVSALAQMPTLQSSGRVRDLRVLLESGLQGALGKTPTLSLGIIQKSMATSLRGDAKKAWLAAMDKVAATADAAAAAGDKENATVKASQIIDAACSVAPALSADDMEALTDYAASSTPVAAAIHAEPPRDGKHESDSLNPEAALVSKYADKARATLDRNKGAAAK